LNGFFLVERQKIKKKKRTRILIIFIPAGGINIQSMILHENPTGMHIIIMKTDPVLLKFEIVVFEVNFKLICDILKDVELRVVAFDVMNDWVLSVVRVEVGVRVDVMDLLGFYENVLELLDIFIDF
jgi:hypothetical protein